MRLAARRLLLLVPALLPSQERVRARDLGVAPGVQQPGPHNAITDVAGVRVGHATVRLGDSIRTGVTAILPHGGNLFLDRVPAAIFVGNGFGKLLGSTQVNELGELESPILSPALSASWNAATRWWGIRTAGIVGRSITRCGATTTAS